MPLPYVSEHILAEGFQSYVRIGNNASDAQVVGFVDSFSMNEDYQVQEARILGQLMPVAIDAQGYSCSISLSGFVPSKKTYEKIRGGTAQLGYRFEKCLFSFSPDARELMDEGTITKYPYIDFVESLTNPTVICHAEGIVVTNTSMSAQGTGYIKYNVSIKALVGEKGYK